MTVNINLEEKARGDLWRYKFTFVDDAGDPVDITNWEIWFTLKTDPEDTDGNAALQHMHVASQGANDNASVGLCYMEVDSADTDVLAIQTYHYDFQYVIPATSPLEVHTISYGKLKVVRDITRSTS